MLAITFTMQPRLAGIIAWLATSRVTFQVPSRLFFTTAAKPLALMCWAGDGNCPPALLTSTSIAPKRSTTPATNRCT